MAEQMPSPAPGPIHLEHLGKGLKSLYLPLPPDPCLVPSSSVLGGRFELLSFRQRPAEDGSPILSSDLSQGKGQPDLSEVIGYIEGLLQHTVTRTCGCYHLQKLQSWRINSL